jgi:hypothetical protein
MLLILRLGCCIHVLACAALLGLVPSASADPKPLTKEEQVKVDKAIDKGVAFLKRSQRREGDWPAAMRGNYRLGQNLLTAYALLESNVPTDDPCIKKAADYIRPRILKTDQTYEVALAVLFLERLGDPKDKPLIRSLTLRLIAGQHVTGGWNYRCPTLGKEREDSLFKAMEDLNKRQEAGGRPNASWLKSIDLPRWVRALAVFRDPSELPWRDPPAVEGKKHNETMTLIVGTTDNSNTQFASLALWAARRQDIPVGPLYA